MLAQIESMFDDMFEGVQILDREFRYLYLNKKALEHARTDRDLLLGQKIVEMYPGFEETEIYQTMRRSMVDRSSQHLLNRFVYPDGKVAWFDLRINPVPQGILVLSIDITTQKVNEEELQRNRDFLSTTLSSMSEAVFLVGRNGQVERLNPVAEKLSGWTSADAEGRLLEDVLSIIDLKTEAVHDVSINAVLSRSWQWGIADNAAVQSRSGEVTPIFGSGAPILNRDGSIQGAVVVLHDAGEELDLLAMLQHSQKMQAVGELAGGVAHDFNNLLTIILGYCEMLQSSVSGDRVAKRQVEQINKAGQRAAKLTRQLLTFSRKQSVSYEVFDPNEVVQRLEPMLKRVISEGIEIETYYDKGLQQVRFDPAQLEQIVMNLALNARDAMPSGGQLTIKTSNQDLDDTYVRTHPEVEIGPYVVIALSDTGVGMTPQTKARIFEPFFTTKDREKGTGLGLSMVYGLVKQAGGHVWVYSEPGFGTTFKIFLPAASGVSIEREESSPPSRSVLPGPKTVLIVEDDADVRSLIQQILEENGYQILAAENADQALGYCRTFKGDIHVLLTDIVMPGMSGPLLVSKAQEIRPGISVLFMSGYLGEAFVRQETLDAGDAFLEKPITPGVLLQAIGRQFD